MRRTAIAASLALVALVPGVPARSQGTPALRAIVTFDGTVPEPAGVRVLYRFAAIPALAVTGTRDAIEALPGVRRITWDRPLGYLMDTAVFATRAAEVWGNEHWPAVRPLPQLEVDGVPVDGRGITVGVVDSGVNGLHPDIWNTTTHVDGVTPWEPKLLACQNIGSMDGDGQPYCDQTVGHGTHVAGIVAGSGWMRRNLGYTQAEKDAPYVGAAPGAKLVAAGMGAAGNILFAAQGLDYMFRNAERFGIRVVTNSWGDSPDCDGAFPSSAIDEIVDRLVAEGIVVLFAAGNYSGDHTVTNSYARNPTPGVISVANYNDRQAADRDHRISGGSSDGCTDGEDSDGDHVWTWPDIAAPGTGISSTVSFSGVLVPPTVNGYRSISGTSMATPHAAGIAALMLQANPDLSPAGVEEILVSTATPWSEDGQAVVTARGFEGTEPHWGAVNAQAGAFVDPSACRITPADAADPVTASERFARFHELPNPELYVCRDFKRGRGLVDARAAVERAIDLRNGG